MNKYESIIIVNPNVDEAGLKALEEKFTGLINENGKVESVENMGKKKLAYEIQNFRDGLFATTILALPADKVAEFKRQLRLNDNILRTMFMEVAEKASV